ncbi:MAG: prepilin-type N-terminal cleavage/methylation domain-containing protein [Heliobacteriaceae bacterium]|nr:prepilin-type N-terminal cleavage/methylation domain-containing protein [Heliobacteriaceae bacterium]
MVNWFRRRLTRVKPEKGFTLIELMVVVAIIGVLFVVLVPKLSSTQDAAKAAGVKTDMRSVEVGLIQYVNDEKAFPADLTSEVYFDAKLKDKDPWGNDYGYATIAASGSDAKAYAIYYSKGPDGKAGVTGVKDTGAYEGAITGDGADDLYMIWEIKNNGEVKQKDSKLR